MLKEELKQLAALLEKKPLLYIIIAQLGIIVWLAEESRKKDGVIVEKERVNIANLKRENFKDSMHLNFIIFINDRTQKALDTANAEIIRLRNLKK